MTAPLVYSTGKKLNNYIKPMLASVAAKAFNNDEWLYELKLDGYRAIAELDGKAVKLYSRNGLSFLDKYPSISAALQTFTHKAILDGEIVLLNDKGRPDFQKLQHYESNEQYPLVYYVFDLLMLDGQNITGLPLTERKELLKQLAGKNPVIQYNDHLEGDAIAFFKKVTEQNMEGIMAKKKDSTYHEGIRTKEWLKIKNIQTHEGVIAGYTNPRGSRQHFGALILGQYDENKQLQYIGHTGTGFNTETLATLWKQMQPLISSQSPFTEKIKVNAPVTWLKPKLVAELNYTEMTNDHIMRHPVFIRIRTDKNPTEITMKEEAPTIAAEKPKKAAAKKETTENKKTITVNKHAVELTNLNKTFWPKEGYTKGDLINYYNRIADYILPYLKNRPLSLKRNPNGIHDSGFYHKDAADTAPAWVNRVEVHSESANKIIHYIVCNNKATLLYLANLGCIEMNPWNSATTKLDKPSYLVIDIDPADNNTFEQVIETALVTKEILTKAGAGCYCKTSGASGLHVYVPLGNQYDYNVSKEFAHIVATMVQEQLPGFTSLERNLQKRGNNIYVDFLQNRTGQTLASAYSLRPRDGATVSTPLEWKEVKDGLHPSQFDMNNIMQRIEKKGDLFAPVLGKGVNIAKCLKKLGGL